MRGFGGKSLPMLITLLSRITSTGPVPDTIRQYCAEGKGDEVIQMIREQFSQGRSTWKTLTRLIGKDLLKQIIRL